MTRTITNLWLDLLASLVMVGLILTGGVTHFVLPPGTGHSLRLFGLGRHDYGEIHFWLALAALVVLVAHVVLHWSFVCCVIARSLGKERPERRLLLVWGAVTFAAMVLLPIVALAWAKSQVQEPGVPYRGHGDRIATVSRPSDTRELDELAPIEAPESLAEEKPDLAAAQRGTAHKHEETCPNGAAINGRSTLGEAAAAAGLSVEALVRELRLSEAHDPNTRLGPLRRQSGLSIHTVRQVVCRKP